MIRRARTLIVLVVTAAASGWPFQARAAGPIPDVRTLADLRRLPVVRTDVGYDVRVGLADPGPEAGPYKLIYCLAAPRPGAATRRDGDVGRYALGPLNVEVARDHDVRELAVQRAVEVAARGEWLACQALPVNWSDGLTVRVYAGRTLLMERPLGRSERRTLYWSRFAVDPTAPQHRPADAEATVDPDPSPACPAFDEWSHLLRRPPVTRPATSPIGSVDDAPLPGSTDLPAEWRQFYYPAAAGPLLRLTFDGDRFVITPDGPVTTGGPLSRHLLARWWVNGRPVPIVGGDHAARKQYALQLTGHVRSEPRTVRFGLPAAVGTLHPGDTVGLQLLWAERTADVSDGLPRAADQRLAQAVSLDAPPVPIPTNRLDVTLTAHLLSVAGR